MRGSDLICDILSTEITVNRNTLQSIPFLLPYSPFILSIDESQITQPMPAVPGHAAKPIRTTRRLYPD